MFLVHLEIIICLSFKIRVGFQRFLLDHMTMEVWVSGLDFGPPTILEMVTTTPLIFPLILQMQ